MSVAPHSHKPGARSAERWRRLGERLASPPERPIPFPEIVSLYDDPPRTYHNLAHIVACLDVFDDVAALADAPDLVEFAIWLHDARYAPGSSTNELESARLAETMLNRMNTEPAAIARIGELILATRHRPEALIGDAALIADVDLAILGATCAEYAAYAEAIRAEYREVPDAVYRNGRILVLQGFLERPRIYRTDWFHSQYDAAARTNLSREIEQLRR